MRGALFLVLLPLLAFAQQADSVLAGILDLQNDTDKVNRLYARGFALRDHDPQLAAAYSRHCTQIAEKAGSPLHLARALHLQGILHYKKGELHKALRLHQRALAIRRQQNDFPGMAMSEHNIGNVLSDLEQPAAAEQAYLRAMQHYRTYGDHKRMAGTLVNIGALKHEKKLFDAAYENYAGALDIAEVNNDHETRSICLNNMAMLLFEKGDYQGSLALNYDALELRELMENEVGITDSYLNLAVNYLNLKDTLQARIYLDSACYKSRRLGYYEGEQAAARLYCDYYDAAGNYRLALQWLKKSEELREKALTEQEPQQIAVQDEEEHTSQQSGINNVWLLFSLAFFACTIPFLMISYRR